MLEESSKRIPNIFVIIDAFDECFSEQTRHQVLQLLQSLTSVKILITSRPLPSIESAMGGVLKLIIAARNGDIRTYFKAQIQINGAMERLTSRVADVNLVDKIIEKADGMFLLASLYTSHLAAQTNAKQLLHALENLPTEATGMYEQTLDRIRQQDTIKRRLAFHTLSWILSALRPLQLIELRHALAIESLDGIATEQDLDDEETIVSSCAGLIVVHRDLRGKTVHLLHYTTEEFLRKTQIASDFLSDLTIAKICLKVISFCGVKSDQTIPFSHTLHQLGGFYFADTRMTNQCWSSLYRNYATSPLLRSSVILGSTTN